MRSGRAGSAALLLAALTVSLDAQSTPPMPLWWRGWPAMVGMRATSSGGAAIPTPPPMRTGGRGHDRRALVHHLCRGRARPRLRPTPARSLTSSTLRATRATTTTTLISPTTMISPTTRISTTASRLRSPRSHEQAALRRRALLRCRLCVAPLVPLVCFAAEVLVFAFCRSGGICLGLGLAYDASLRYVCTCLLRSPWVVECRLSPVPAALVLVLRAVCPRSPFLI